MSVLGGHSFSTMFKVQSFRLLLKFLLKAAEHWYSKCNLFKTEIEIEPNQYQQLDLTPQTVCYNLKH